MLLPSAIFLQMEVCAYMILNCKNMIKWKQTVTQEFWETECKSFRLNYLMEDFCKEAIKDRIKTRLARKRDDAVEDGEKKKLVEATSELFLQKYSSYSFSRNILHYRPTMLEYCLNWWVTINCTTLQIFQVRKTVEDPRKSTNLPKRCLIKLVWRSVKESEDDSSWASCSSWPHILWIRLVKISGYFHRPRHKKWPIQYCCMLTSLRHTHLKAIYFHVSSPMMSFYYPDNNI